eukprot:COSAG02_NODE_45640_length_355_cov_0.851562_1_plen_61_part_10
MVQYIYGNVYTVPVQYGSGTGTSVQYCALHTLQYISVQYSCVHTVQYSVHSTGGTSTVHFQ